MTDSIKKLVERRFLEAAQTAYSEFPEGIVTESERPDFVVTTDGRQVGIEVRRLVQPQPSAVESFRTEVVQLGQECYQAMSERPLDVTVAFSSLTAGKQSKRQLAKVLAEFVRTNYVDGDSAIQHFP